MAKPLAPKKIADKFVRQCGVLVKDQLPIKLQEWRAPAKPRPDVTFVDKNQKDLLWDTLMGSAAERSEADVGGRGVVGWSGVVGIASGSG